MKSATRKAAAPTGIVYCRTSTGKQRDNETIGAQIDRCKRIVERYGIKLAKYGPKRDGWLLDDGISGSMLDGRAFAAFIDDLRARRLKVGYLVVFNLSRINRLDKTSGDMERLIRSHEHNGLIKAVLIGAGVIVIDEEGENDPRTKNYDIKTAISAGEYNDLRDRTMAGKQRLAREGAWSKGGLPPYGYDRAKKNGKDRKAGFVLVPHEEQAPALRQIFRWYIEKGTYVDKNGKKKEKGGTTYAARRATEAGFPPAFAASPKRSDPKTWWAASVLGMVKVARMYALGEQTVTIGGEPNTNKFEPIIDGKLYAAVKARSKQRTLKHRAMFLSTGFAKCAQCGAHVHSRTSDDHHVIKCGNACGWGVREEKFSAALWTAIVCRLLQIKQHQNKNGRNGADDTTAALEAARASVEAVNVQIARLADAYVAGLDKTVFKTKNDALNDRKAAAQAEVDGIQREREAQAQKKVDQQSVEGRVGKLLDELTDHPQPTLERKREVLADLLAGERVMVAWPQGRRGPWSRGQASAAITLPAFGSLPPVTVRTDQPVAELAAGGMIVNDADDLRELRDMLGNGRDAERVKLGDVWLAVRPRGSTGWMLGLQTPAGVLAGGGDFIPLVKRKAASKRGATARAEIARG